MEVSITSGPVVTCCNGGSPFVDVVRWTPKWSHFLTDEGPDSDSCQTFRVQFYDERTLINYKKMNGSLSCKCESDFYGSQCQLKRGSSGSGSGNGSNFKMSLFLAVVPLSFAVFAAVGGLLCKMFPCCICFDFEWPKNCLGFGKKLSHRDNNSTEYDYDEDEDYAHNTHPHLHNIQVDVHSVDLVPIGNHWNVINDHSEASRSPLTMRPETSDAGHFSIPSEGIIRSDMAIVNRTVPTLPDDPPPPFSHTDPAHNHPAHCCNCRKYSPPPPYSEVAESVRAVEHLS